MTNKEKLENVANIALSAGAIVSLLAGAKAISCLLFGLVLFTINTKWLIFKTKNKLWRKK